MRVWNFGDFTILIAQRNWRGDIDVPKTEKSKRTLALGGLVGRYRDWIAKLPNKGPDAFVFPNESDASQAPRIRIHRSAR